MEKINVRFSDESVKRMTEAARKVNVSFSEFARAAASIGSLELGKLNAELANLKIKENQK